MKTITELRKEKGVFMKDFRHNFYMFKWCKALNENGVKFTLSYEYNFIRVIAEITQEQIENYKKENNVHFENSEVFFGVSEIEFSVCFDLYYESDFKDMSDKIEVWANSEFFKTIDFSKLTDEEYQKNTSVQNVIETFLYY